MSPIGLGNAFCGTTEWFKRLKSWDESYWRDWLSDSWKAQGKCSSGTTPIGIHPCNHHSVQSLWQSTTRTSMRRLQSLVFSFKCSPLHIKRTFLRTGWFWTSYGLQIFDELRHSMMCPADLLNQLLSPCVEGQTLLWDPWFSCSIPHNFSIISSKDFPGLISSSDKVNLSIKVHTEIQCEL